MTLLRFRVSLLGIKGLYRIIEAGNDCTLEALHEAIYQAFDRDDPHLYSFYITGEDTRSLRKIREAPEITHPENCGDDYGFPFNKDRDSAAKVTLADLDLMKGDVIHYLFDFGDEWWHRVRVDEISEGKQGKIRVKMVKSVGESPPQY